MAVSAAIGGYRLGLITRSLSWVGMLAGLLFGARFLPEVVGLFRNADPVGRLVVAGGFFTAASFLGQAAGMVVGRKVHLILPASTRPIDRAGGSLAGVGGMLVALWLLLPAAVDVPGVVAQLVHGSRIAQAIDTAAPKPPNALRTLRGLVGEGQFPQVFEALRPSPRPGPPPIASGLNDAMATAVSASTVRVEGPACDRTQEGSGFVVAPGLVVTNAHVVAGEDSTELIRTDGRRVRARVVAFDPDRDLALLDAPGIDRNPLPMGDGHVGTIGAVFGYPGGGPLELSPFEISEEVTAVGRDLYDSRQTRRKVLVLASSLAPGDSGSALVDAAGSLVGVAFAIAPDRPGTAYALDLAELQALLDTPRPSTVDTGPCLH
ncbi:MAG: MarP family serine protease [Actinobacteria bacterium]|nr:MarP family serine protease [Actinomycetota bacterium]MBI3256246.1 MarP family serine protease [Actinomycetota bacterium]